MDYTPQYCTFIVLYISSHLLPLYFYYKALEILHKITLETFIIIIIIIII